MTLTKAATVLALVLAGCATTSTGPVSAGKDTYMISKQAGIFPTGKEPLLQDAMSEATAFCSVAGKTMKVVSVSENMQPIGNFPKATLIFSCQ